MIVKKNTNKPVKACEDVTTSFDEALEVAELATDGLVETPVEIDFNYVRTEVKALIDYLSQFDCDCAKETVGNLAYIYCDLTDCVKSDD